MNIGQKGNFLMALTEQLSPQINSFIIAIDSFTEYEDQNHADLRGSKATPAGQDLEAANSIQVNLAAYSNVSVASLVEQTHCKKFKEASHLTCY